MEECILLADARNPVERDKLGAWKTRHILKPPEKKKKGPVGPDKEEEEKLERFFRQIYEFHNPVPNAAPVFVPAALPPQYAISFVPAVISAASASVSASAPVASPFAFSPSTDYSIVSSPNFAVSSPNLAVSPSPVYSIVSSANFAAPVSVSTFIPCIDSTH